MFGIKQGRIQDFLREGASQAGMTDVQSQKSDEELPNMYLHIIIHYFCDSEVIELMDITVYISIMINA